MLYVNLAATKILIYSISAGPDNCMTSKHYRPQVGFLASDLKHDKQVNVVTK